MNIDGLIEYAKKKLDESYEAHEGNCRDCGRKGELNPDNLCPECFPKHLIENTVREAVREFEVILEQHDFRRCDIPACNCGSYHYHGKIVNIDKLMDKVEKHRISECVRPNETVCEKHGLGCVACEVHFRIAKLMEKE